MKISFSSAKNTTYKPTSQIHQPEGLYKPFLPANQVSNRPDSFIRNPNILSTALSYLDNLEFHPRDIEKVQRYGVTPVFKSGTEALKFAKKNNVQIKFGKVQGEDVHAQWEHDKNTVTINERYKDTRSLDEILAISSAILHELSHAKDSDNRTSIQEEINCLGMNALAFNVFQKKHPNLFQGKNSPIIDDGVKLYTKLFFGNDEKALIKRIQEKYGDLPLESPNHRATLFAFKILSPID